MLAYADNIAQKRDAFIRFIAGLRMADAWLNAQKNLSVAAVLESTGQDQFGGAGILLPQLVTSIQYNRVTWQPTGGGFISAAAWNTSLKTWSGWQLAQDVTQPLYSYSSRVDMSLWNAATSLVQKLTVTRKTVTTKKK
jgi:hypothetical protein